MKLFSVITGFRQCLIVARERKIKGGTFAWQPRDTLLVATTCNLVKRRPQTKKYSCHVPTNAAFFIISRREHRVLGMERWLYRATRLTNRLLPQGMQLAFSSPIGQAVWQLAS